MKNKLLTNNRNYFALKIMAERIARSKYGMYFAFHGCFALSAWQEYNVEHKVYRDTKELEVYEFNESVLNAMLSELDAEMRQSCGKIRFSNVVRNDKSKKVKSIGFTMSDGATSVGLKITFTLVSNKILSLENCPMINAPVANNLNLLCDALHDACSTRALKSINSFFDLYMLSGMWAYRSDDVLSVMKVRYKNFETSRKWLFTQDNYAKFQRMYTNNRSIQCKPDFDRVWQTVAQFAYMFYCRRGGLFWRGKGWEQW